MKKIQDLKKGDYFKIIINADGKISNAVYVYDGYCNVNRKYSAYRFDDISTFRYFAKGFTVVTEFEF